MKLEKIIYKMLIENTGIHMCDSGGDDGRGWQRNQKKSLKDFIDETDTTHFRRYQTEQGVFGDINLLIILTSGD